MIISMLFTERAMLETLLSKVIDIQEKPEFNRDTDVLTSTYVANGLFTTSQLRRFLDVKRLLTDRIAAIDAEISRYEREAPSCMTADDLLAMMAEGSADTCSEAEAWWELPESLPEVEYIHDLPSVRHHANGVSELRQGSQRTYF